MRRESQAPEAYEDVIRHIGAPNRTITDNTKVCKSNKWVTVNRRFFIETGLTVPHHQHQNYAEREGGDFKFRILKLFIIPHMRQLNIGVMLRNSWIN